MRTQATLDRIIEALQANCGDTLDACRTVGVSLIFLNQWRKDDAEVHELVLEAERVGTQGLVSEAIRRGARGHDEPVYHKGEEVGTRKVYSDGLLQTLLKAKVQEFAKDGEGSGVHVNVNVANIMPRAEGYDQWLAMKDSTFQLLREQERQLIEGPAPVTVDAEFAEVQSAFKGIAL